VVRVLVASVVLLLLLGFQTFKDEPVGVSDMQAVLVVFGFWTTAGLWALWLWPRRQTSPLGRQAALAFDIVATTVAMVLAGKTGAFFYPIYQWIVVGHGVRFGRSTMLVAAGMALIGFSIAILVTPYWHDNIFTASGLLIGLVVLPMYMTSLLDRLNSLNQQLQHELERTSHSARHDTLTGLPNRQTFFDRLDLAIDRSARSGRGFAVMFIDLDDFKEVNDRLGHLAGDTVLATVGERLQRCCRDDDFSGRFGGDEFALLFDDIDDCEQALAAAGRVAGAIGEAIVLKDGRQATMSASIGISLFPIDGQSPGELTHAADLAMYATKRSGKHGYACYSDMDDGDDEHLAREA